MVSRVNHTQSSGQSGAKLVEELLAKPDMHQAWQSDYRTPDNAQFFERAFDLIVTTLNPQPGSTFLDAGCGSCAHSVRLARRGFRVEGVDFSESALGLAKEHIRQVGLEDRIQLQRENLTALSYPNETFDYAVCWGVLMHIPEVEHAIAELARVMKPGGFLVVSEGNKSSVEAVALRALKRVLNREKAVVRNTRAGVEHWVRKADGALVTRQADIGWLIKQFEQRQLHLVRRLSGQFTEAYTRVSMRPLKRLIHALNNFWFSYVPVPALAFGNILIFRRDDLRG
jgi:ubiquinone/menaquinone biosynthesis C-methylase UbiE